MSKNIPSGMVVAHRDLYHKLIDKGGMYTFVKNPPLVPAYIQGGKDKGFESELTQVYVWSLYFEDGELMAHVYDHADDDMHSANITIADIADSAVDELLNQIE